MKKTAAFYLLVLLFAIPIAETYVSADTMDEYKIKSNYLYLICKYTRWKRKAGFKAPIDLAVIGQTTPGNEIEIPPTQLVRKRKIITRKIKRLEDIGDAHVLFICASEAYRIDKILKLTAGSDILTVGDTKGYGKKGANINFYVWQGSVKFEINRQSVKESTIELHSNLFTIGRVIETDKNVNVGEEL
ncbi:MAG: YfiR family protein [bacterium]|nr:YfiR family protein [bacterium]